MQLRLRRHKRSRNWYLRGTIRGVSVDESTRTDNREAAEAIRIKREAEILDRSVYGARETTTFLEAAVAFLFGEAEYSRAHGTGRMEVSGHGRKVRPRKPRSPCRRYCYPSMGRIREP